MKGHTYVQCTKIHVALRRSDLPAIRRSPLANQKKGKRIKESPQMSEDKG